MRNTRQLFGSARRELAPVQHAYDLGRENGACLLKIGIGTAEVAEHVAAAAHQFKIILAHRRASFSRLIRSLMRSTSTCGVLIPLFDFFWNASITHTSSPIRTA